MSVKQGDNGKMSIGGCLGEIRLCRTWLKCQLRGLRRYSSAGAGELEVFSSIEDALSQSLPQDPCEWRRSMGRPVRMVRIGANFAPFSPAALPKNNQWDLVRQPVFHVYWTECSVSLHLRLFDITDFCLQKNTKVI